MFTHDVTKYEKDQRCHCQKRAKQESISVGCVPSAAVTVGRGGAVLQGECVSQHAVRQTPPPCEQNDRQMPVKILPCRSFVADGKHVMCKQILSNTILSYHRCIQVYSPASTQPPSPPKSYSTHLNHGPPTTNIPYTTSHPLIIPNPISEVLPIAKLQLSVTFPLRVCPPRGLEFIVHDQNQPSLSCPCGSSLLLQ